MISIKDIAREVNASISSVSLVLNGKGKDSRISDGLAARIREAATRLGYQANQVAVGLRTGQTKTIALIVEDIANHFFSALAKTVEHEAKGFGFNIVLCSTENNVDKAREVIRMLSKQQMAGYLIAPMPGIENEIRALVLNKRPVVLMDGYMKDSDIPYVVVNNYIGMQHGIELLIRKGYRKIGYVTVDQQKLQIIDREEAWRNTLKKNRLPCTKKQLLTVSFDEKETEAENEIEAFLLANKGLDAVVFATNYLGIYGLKSLRKLKMIVPESIAVLCFDDHDIFDLYTPSITAIQQPLEEMAKAAVLILMELMKVIAPGAEHQLQLPVKIKERGSV